MLDTCKNVHRTDFDASVLQWGQIKTWKVRGETEKSVGGRGLNSADFNKHYIIFNSFYSTFKHRVFIHEIPPNKVFAIQQKVVSYVKLYIRKLEKNVLSLSSLKQLNVQ